MTAQEHPEPTEPPLVMVPGGVYCLTHGEMDCTLPFCWRCGNHEMDDFERCADPRCHASNDATAREVVEMVRDSWPDGPAPLELIALEIGRAYAAGPSSLVPGEPGGGGDDIGVPATGAGPTKPMSAELPAIDSTRRIEPYRVTRNRERGIR